jgi:hypothetical protein
MIQQDRCAPRLFGGGAFPALMAREGAERRGSRPSVCLFMLIAQGSALARARVKHEAVPAGAVSPIFRASC